jgi:hypothetical protein
LADFYWTVVLTVLNIALPYAITRYDRSRLDPRELARAWNVPSWACAVYFFGPLSLPAHFFVTRRTLRGLLLGAIWTVAVFAAEWLAGLGIETVVA